MKHQDVIPFPKKKIRKKKEEGFKAPVLLDQYLRGEHKPIFHLSHYLDIEVSVPASRAPKPGSRFIFLVDTKICNFKPSGRMIIQFLPKSVRSDVDSAIVSGQLIADREIPRLLAISFVQEALVKQKETAPG